MDQALPVSLSAVVEALSTMATPEAATLLTQVAATNERQGGPKGCQARPLSLENNGGGYRQRASWKPRKSVLEVPKLPIVIALASQIDFAGNRALYLAGVGHSQAWCW